MTAVADEHAAVIEASEDDLREAVRIALLRAGMTFAELSQQAVDGRFDSVRGRRAWVAIGDLGHLAER